jgi:hypothetical protein
MTTTSDQVLLRVTAWRVYPSFHAAFKVFDEEGLVHPKPWLNWSQAFRLLQDQGVFNPHRVLLEAIKEHDDEFIYT